MFCIHNVNVGTGQIAISPVPGRFGTYEENLSVILQWAPDLVLTMTTQPELDRVGASSFGDDLGFAEISWHHLPILDFGAPDETIVSKWAAVSKEAKGVLSRGGKILIHCFGGCGRSGMAALRLMVEAGEDPKVALDRLRAVRPCAVETDAQFKWASKTSV